KSDCPAVVAHRGAERVEDTSRSRLSHFRIAVCDDHKLVAAEAGHEIGRMAGRSQSLSHQSKYIVADLMSQAIIGLLEAVAIEEDCRDWSPKPFCDLQLL